MNGSIAAALAEMNVCMPGVVDSYDGKTVIARPAMPKQLANGESLAAPLIVQVPVCWPIADGGRAMITVPLKPGDPVVLHFSQRSLENWLSGSDQAPDDPRQFDLTDAFATPVMRPGPVADTENVSVQYNSAWMKISPDGIITFDGTHMVAKCPATFEKLVTYKDGIAGTGGSNGNSLEGGLALSGGQLTHNGKNVGSDHAHSKVQPGSGNSGGPV